MTDMGLAMLAFFPLQTAARRINRHPLLKEWPHHGI
jgi:hypothetical protein